MKLLKIDDSQYITAKNLVAIFYNTKMLHTVAIAAGFGPIKCKSDPVKLAEQARELGIEMVEVGDRQYINKAYLIGIAKAKFMGKTKLIIQTIGVLESGYGFDVVLKNLDGEKLTKGGNDNV